MQPWRAAFPVDYPQRTKHRLKTITCPLFIRIEVLIVRPLRHIYSVPHAPQPPRPSIDPVNEANHPPPALKRRARHVPDGTGIQGTPTGTHGNSSGWLTWDRSGHSPYSRSLPSWWRHITRGTRVRGIAATCTNSTPDYAQCADCTGISRPLVPRHVPRRSALLLRSARSNSGRSGCEPDGTSCVNSIIVSPSAW